MNTSQKQYYRKMLHKEQLFPFIRDGRLVCFITFVLLQKKEDAPKDHWNDVENSPEGTVCYIMQLITDKHPSNPKLSYGIWKEFKEYIKYKFPKVESIFWKRYNKEKGEVHVYDKVIR